MPIDRLDFDNLGENDLNELLADQIPEGLRIDYKQEVYGRTDADRREALKDVSGFANAFGGHLIIGVAEAGGLPISISPIMDVNPDEVVLRLEQLILSGIEPRIQGIRIKAVSLANGGYCFVLRIPRSWYPPHRVSAQNSNRFWLRHSGGTHEASMEELRTLFILGGDALHRIRGFRDERIAAIVSGNGAHSLRGGGRLIFHIVPLAISISSWQIDLAKALELNPVFRPMGGTGWSPRFNFDGLINERGGHGDTGYTQIFRDGSLEATYASLIREHRGLRFIHANTLERRVFEIYPGYVNGLRDLGVPPPLVILLSLEGVKGIPYKVGQDIFDDPEPGIEREILCLPECVINEYGPDGDYHRAVKPAFDALWNAAGYVGAQSFSVDGLWTGNLQNR